MFSDETPSLRTSSDATPTVVKAKDNQVRDMPTMATIKGDTVVVVTTLAGKPFTKTSFTVSDWEKALKKWPNEHYAADEFIKQANPEWQQAVDDGASDLWQRVMDSQIAAVRKALSRAPGRL